MVMNSFHMCVHGKTTKPTCPFMEEGKGERKVWGKLNAMAVFNLIKKAARQPSC